MRRLLRFIPTLVLVVPLFGLVQLCASAYVGSSPQDLVVPGLSTTATLPSTTDTTSYATVMSTLTTSYTVTSTSTSISISTTVTTSYPLVGGPAWPLVFLMIFSLTFIGGIGFGYLLGSLVRGPQDVRPVQPVSQPEMSRFGLASDIGTKAENEDAAAIDHVKKVGSALGHECTIVVADGVSGEAEGKTASRLAVNTIISSLQASRDRDEDALSTAIKKANNVITAYATDELNGHKTATTVVAAIVGPIKISIGNVGDSRAYLYRQGGLFQLTKDHTVPQQLVEQQKISEAEARVHPERHVLTNALGHKPDVEPDVESYEVRAGDVLLLCTDGLTEVLSDSQIASVMTGKQDMQRLSETIVHYAKLTGARDRITVDNITVALVRI